MREQGEPAHVVVYEDGGGGVQVWVGPSGDWPAMSKEYTITEDDILDHFAFVGEVVPANEREELTFSKEED